MKSLTTPNSNIIDETSLFQNINDRLLKIPNPNSELMDGVKWGCYSKLFTPAYWKAQYLFYDEENSFNIDYKLGQNILEEVVACLLGGFGLKAELGLLAFRRLKNNQLIKKRVYQEDILINLKKPFLINGKEVRYRFPNQKAKYISLFLNRNDLDNIPLDNDIKLRDWLLNVQGIGPKTASWITRNQLDSEKVAIIDIHIFKALKFIGVFDKNYDISKDYYILESLFIDFCDKINVLPSKMDAIIWLQMKNLSRGYR